MKFICPLKRCVTGNKHGTEQSDLPAELCFKMVVLVLLETESLNSLGCKRPLISLVPLLTQHCQVHH